MNFRAGCSELKDLNVQHLSKIQNFISRCLLLLPLFHASLRRAVGAAALSLRLTKVFWGGPKNWPAVFFPQRGAYREPFRSDFFSEMPNLPANLPPNLLQNLLPNLLLNLLPNLLQNSRISTTI